MMTEPQNDPYFIPKGKISEPAPAINKGTFTVFVMFGMFAAGGYVLNGDDLPDWVGIMMAFGPIGFAIVYQILPDAD